MKAWMRKTIASSLIITAVSIIALLMFTRTEAYAQFLASYQSLSKAEQRWVLRHPIAAFRTHHLADTARDEAKKRKDDPDLDGDLNGGMVDAFKHTFWMALTAQKIGFRKAKQLGLAHEEGNREEFNQNPERTGGLIQDSLTSAMDLYNNDVGARIGEKYPNASIDVLAFLAKEAVLKGECMKLRKKGKDKYLDENGEIINIDDYKGKWAIPKTLIPSNQQ